MRSGWLVFWSCVVAGCGGGAGGGDPSPADAAAPADAVAMADGGGGDAAVGDASTPGPDGATPDVTRPVVGFAAPVDGATVSGEVPVEVTATDDRGVVRVEVLVDGAPGATLESPPYRWTWSTAGLQPGPYALTARAYDEAGNAGEASVAVRLAGACNADGDCPPQSVRVVTPVDGATVCGRLAVEAAATDDVGIARVEIQVDGVPIGSADEAPYAAEWDTTRHDDGEHVVRAVAHDTAGQTAFGLVRVRVRNEGESPCDNLPNVALTEPAADARVFGAVQVVAQASDDVGVVGVDFFVDNGRVASDDAAPYRIEWNSDEFDEGVHTLKAVARDTTDKTAAAQIAVTIDRTPPQVRIVEPQPGASAGDALTVALEAVDNDAVAAVDVWIEDTFVMAHLDAPPWEVELATAGLDAGPQRLRVRAQDRAGHEAEAEVEIVVDRPPTVAFVTPEAGARIEGAIEVEVSADDDLGRPGVELFVDDERVGAFDDGRLRWEPAYEAAERTLRAVATDDAGQTAEARIVVTVDHPLEVVLERCEPDCRRLRDDERVSGTLDARVTWRDDDGEVTRVDLAVDGDVVGADDRAPFELLWNTTSVPDGDHVLRARATSTNGATAEVAVRVQVANCDRDGDGVAGGQGDCAGRDCDDGDPEVHPGADDRVGDDVDQSCDGADGVDADADGHASVASGGGDCDDDDGTRHPGAEDAAGDGRDENCDGADGVDADGDGHASLASGGDDCDDARAAIHPGAPDELTLGPDCDLAPAEVIRPQYGGELFPPIGCREDLHCQIHMGGNAQCLPEQGLCSWLCNDEAGDAFCPDGYHCIGRACHFKCDDWGADLEFDTSGAGALAEGACGGAGPERVFALDLRGPATVAVRVVDAHFPAVLHIRSSCGEADAEEACAPRGEAIRRDLPPGRHYLFVDGAAPDASGRAVVRVIVERWCDPAGGTPVASPAPDGVDQNCDGVDGTDADGDGVASVATGGADCDDRNPSVRPCAPDVAGDGFDGNCDGRDEESCDDCDPCTLDRRDAAACSHDPIPEGGDCEDGDLCTTGEVCRGGVCGGGGAVVCDDENACTVDACDPAVGCAPVPVEERAPCPGGVCSDGACCAPDCDGRECGDDGCGGTCGACEDGAECLDGGICRVVRVVSFGRVDTQGIAAAGDAGCEDFNDDGRPDNSFAGVADFANAPMQTEIDEGRLNTVVAALGLAEPGDRGPFGLALMNASAGDGPRTYVVDADALDEDGEPLALLPAHAAADGTFRAGPGRFDAGLPAAGVTLALPLRSAVASGRIELDGFGGMQIANGRLAGWVTREDLEAAMLAIPPELRGLLGLFLQPDIDTDADGTPDAYSLCYVLAAGPARVLGYPLD